MAGIITSDLEETVNPQKTPLIVEECLGEFNDGLKALARENLNVYDRDSVYNKSDSENLVNESIQKAFDRYLNEDDPHGILPIVDQKIEGFVKLDGSTPFLAPLAGLDPIQDFHLATKRFVTKVLRDHLNDNDPHLILPQVLDILELYVKLTEVYFKSLLYTKNEIDVQSGKYIKRDGSIPFTKAQIGADPQIDSHLATKRYVDKVIYNHLVDIDPHGFVALLNNRLAAYAKTANVYDKSLTYSRVQLDSIIRGLVNDAAHEAIIDHLNQFDPHNILAEIRKEKYIKLDGTVPFRNPLVGVDAVNDNELVTLQQLKNSVEKIPQSEWITSGPVESTVGYVEEGTKVPDTMTFLEIMDAIFYGKGISIDAPEYVTIGKPILITVCVHGSAASIDHAELLKDGESIMILTREDFENGCATIEVDPIDKDAEFTLKVIYLNDSEHEETIIVKCSYPVFVGLLPKWKFGTTITMDYLEELAKTEPNNNVFVDFGPTDKTVSIEYDFSDPQLRHPFVVVPVTYPNLTKITIAALSFGIEAFDIIDMIPLQVAGKDIIYKIYIYRQALSSLDQKVTFNF